MEDAVEVAPGKYIAGSSWFHNALFLTRNGRWKMEDAVEVAPGKTIAGVSCVHNALFLTFTSPTWDTLHLPFSPLAFVFVPFTATVKPPLLSLSLSFFFN